MENENPESGKSNPATVEQFQAEFQSLMERYRPLFPHWATSGNSSMAPPVDAANAKVVKKPMPE